MSTTALTVYRRSALEDVACLYRWKTIWVEGVDDSSDYSLRGQAFADIKHRYIQRLVERQVASDYEEALAAFTEGIAEHQTPAHLIPEVRELWFRHAEVFTLDLDRYLAAEEREVDPVLGMSWAPDLVYAHPTELEIVDDKSFYVMLTESELRGNFQARAYTLAARRRWPGFGSYRFTMNFVRFNKVTSVVFTHAELDHAELEAHANRARIERAMQTGQWPAVAGPSCRFCELRCPIVDLPERMPVRLSSEQAPQVAAMVLVGDKAVRGLKKALKAYCAANGPVMVGDVEFANRPVTSRSYPVEKVVAVLNHIGHAGALEVEGLTVSHSALGKLFKAYPGVEQELAPYATTKEIFRFGGKRPGEDDDE